MKTALLVLSLIALAASCAGPSSATSRIVDADPAVRGPMLDAVSALEGRWMSTTPYGEGVHEFKVSSAGSVVREIMSPGTDHEMTNIYALDGNSMVMTHYCGAGNQPRMRAAALKGNRLVFESESVSDLKDPGELYMGAMTLVFVDDDTVEQHWTSITDGATEEMGVFMLRRVN